MLCTGKLHLIIVQQTLPLHYSKRYSEIFCAFCEKHEE